MEGRKDIVLKADTVDSEGKVSGVVATFDTVDRQGDVVKAGSVGEQTAFIGGWGHEGGEPHGTAKFYETDTEVRFDAQYFLNTQASKDAFAIVKAAPELTEWSMYARILEREYGKAGDQDVMVLTKLDFIHAAPVQRGAQIGTRTTSVKSDETPPPAEPPPAAPPAEDPPEDPPAEDPPEDHTDADLLLLAAFELERFRLAAYDRAKREENDG